MSLCKILDSVVQENINESLDPFFKKVSREHYDKRRETLREVNDGASTAIDSILKTCLHREALYPPESASLWVDYYSKLGSEKVYKQILLVYLKLDIGNYLNLKRGLNKGRSKDKTELASLEEVSAVLSVIPHSFDFPSSVIQLTTGLWAVDNEQTNLMVSTLSNPSINLADYFKIPKDLSDIIVESLFISRQPRLALMMSKIHRYENWDENYNEIYAFLLIKSGQLGEALKYERMFSERSNYNEILLHFFGQCSEQNLSQTINCLNLTVKEEEALNQHFISESRPITPSGTQIKHISSSTTKSKPRNRGIQVVRSNSSVNDSPARNTRSARKKKN